MFLSAFRAIQVQDGLLVRGVQPAQDVPPVLDEPLELLLELRQELRAPPVEQRGRQGLGLPQDGWRLMGLPAC